MQLPSQSARWSVRVVFGGYVARRLQREGHHALAKSALAVTQGVIAAGRALEDARFAAQYVLADRDAADDQLDEAAKDLRHGLAARSRNAVNEAPFTAIFPEGLGYYTAATLSEQVTRYGELRARAESHLGTKDALRKPILDRLDRGTAAWREAVGALDEAHATESLATTALSKAVSDFDRQMTRTYGTLLADHGKDSARRLFPSTRRRGASDASEPGAPTPQG